MIDHLTIRGGAQFGNRSLMISPRRPKATGFARLASALVIVWPLLGDICGAQEPTLGSKASAQPLIQLPYYLGSRPLRHVGNAPLLTFAGESNTLLSFRGGSRASLKSWDITSGGDIEPKIDAPFADVMCVSRDRQIAALATRSRGMAAVYQIATGKQMANLEMPSGRSARKLALSAQGDMLAVADDKGRLRVVDIARNNNMWTAEGVANCTGLAFSPDGRLLLSVQGYDERGKPGSIRRWSVASGEERGELARGSFTHILFVSNRILVSAEKGRVQSWDLSTGKESREYTVAKDAIPLCLAISPDGKWIVAGLEKGGFTYSPGRIALWKVDTGEKQVEWDAHPHSSGVRAVAFSSDSVTLASASFDPEIRLWDTRTAKRLHESAGHASPVGYLAFSPDSACLATSGDHESMVNVWSACSGSVLQRFTSEGRECISGIAYGDKDTIAVASGGTIDLHDVARGRARRVGVVDSRRTITSLSFVGKTKQVAVWVREEGLMKVWDVATSQVRTVGGRSWAYSVAAFDASGRRVAISVATAAKETQLIVYDNDLQQELYTRMCRKMSFLSFSRDGRTLVGLDEDGNVNGWEVATGELRWRIAKAIERVISRGEAKRTPYALSPCGRYLVVASASSLSVRDLAAEGRVIQAISDLPARVCSVSFSPGGNMLAAGMEDTTVLLWRVVKAGP